METPNERLALLRVALGFTRKALFAESVGIERSSYDKIEKGPNKPSGESLEKVLTKYPQVNANWLLTGRGAMLLTLVPALVAVPTVPSDEPPPTPAAPAAGLPFSGEILDKLLAQINTQAQQHREELAQLKKEHRAALMQQARGAQYHMDAMTEKVYFLEGRLGLRPLTAAETQAQQAADAQVPPKKKIGLKHYDESAPTGRVLMLACVRRGETSALRAA